MVDKLFSKYEMAYFKKLSLDLQISECPDHSEVLERFDASKRVSLIYYKLGQELVDEMLDKLPEPLQREASVSLTTITGPGLAVPHRDHDCVTKINYVLKGQAAVTQFHELANPEGFRLRYEGKKSSNLFYLADLVDAARFTAQDGECYALDVTKIHSVILTKREPRIMLSYSFKYVPFEEVIKHFD